MNLKGYIFSRPFLGERAPQHIQNIIIKDYCTKNNYKLLLSATEYVNENSTHILNELILNIKKYDGLVFYSLLQLPIDFRLRKKIYEKILKNNKSIHFAVENIKIQNENDKDVVEKIFKIKIATLDNQVRAIKKGKLKNFITLYHKKTKRNYLERVNDKKVECMKVSKKYDYNYWDGNRKFGYGGYKYIKAYFKPLAKKIIKSYNLTNSSKVIDLGCGKGFLIYEIKKILPNIKIIGIDISKYAKLNSKKEIRKSIFNYDIKNKLKFKRSEFDLVLCINTLHNLKLEDLERSLLEIERIGKRKFICVESYRNIKEQFNLQCWALTAETIMHKSSWLWLFNKIRYSGDYEFIYFQ